MSTPARTIGILGGGQLARMMAVEARRMGLDVLVLDPDLKAPASAYATGMRAGRLDDVAAVAALARECDVLTLDTEHAPADVLDAAVTEAGHAVARPAPSVLRQAQDRLFQKQFLADRKIPTSPFAPVHDEASLQHAVATVGAPAVLKRRKGGYDGRGQARVQSAADAAGAWESLGRAPCIWEAFVPFEREVSVVLARAVDGTVVPYSVAQNEHRKGVLHITVAPALVSEEEQARALQIATAVIEGLGHVGILAVEMFRLPDGQLLVNEIAPRVHNSGHFTLGACETTQFEQHLRAVAGLPLGSPRQLRPAAMLNLLGDLWGPDGSPPDFLAVHADPHAKLHLYGKRDAFPGRKMGHVTLLADTPEEALAKAQALYERLAGSKRE